MGKTTKKTIEEVDNLLGKYGFERCKDEIYKRNNIRMRCIDSKGYIVMVKIDNLKIDFKATRFFNGNPYTEQNIKHYIKINNLPIKLKEGQELKSSIQKLIWICLIDGKEFKKSWNNVQQGQYCPYCSNSKSVAKEMNPLSNRKDLLKYLKYTEDAYKYSQNSSEKINLVCPICSKERKMVINNFTNKGFYCDYCNSIENKRPDLIIYLKNKKDGERYGIGSTKNIKLICPQCKTERKMTPNQLTRCGFNCKNCSEGVSIPEKFCYALLLQLKIEFKTQYTINNKRYDFYFEKDNKKWIIETHGSQHYKQSFENIKGAKTLKQEQENDKFKKKIALDNNIDNYIIVDCRNSDYEFLKKSFIKELKTYFNLNSIDWKEINSICLKSLMKEAIDLWNSGIKSTSEIANILKLSKSTIKTYLKRGTESGLCNYNPKEQMKLNGSKNGKKSCIPIQQYLNNMLIAEYPSAMEAERQTGINHKNISACIHGTRKTAGGYLWRKTPPSN